MIGYHNVHCRIGSLENKITQNKNTPKVHCRIGSLERSAQLQLQLMLVHCRIGSLEKRQKYFATPKLCSLPYRQLRKRI